MDNLRKEINNSLVDTFRELQDKSLYRQDIAKKIKEKGLNFASFNEEEFKTIDEDFSNEVKDFKTSFDFKIIAFDTDGEFEYSENYLLFWEIFEKANNFLNNIIELSNNDLNERNNHFILDRAIKLNSNWLFYNSLIKKYGLVNVEEMPSNLINEDLDRLIELISLKMRQSAALIRRFKEKNSDKMLNVAREKVLKDLFNLLTYCLGEPPTNSIKLENDLLGDLFTIANLPGNSREINKIYKIKYSDKVENYPEYKFINLSFDDFTKSIINQIDNGSGVWVICEADKMSDTEHHLYDTEIFNYNETLGTCFDLDKAKRIDYCENLNIRSALIVAYHRDNERVTKWKMVNPKTKETYILTNTWFELYVYKAIIFKKYILKSLKNVDEETLPAWDNINSILYTS